MIRYRLEWRFRLDRLLSESGSVNEADYEPQAPFDVHGWPLPAPPLFVAGLFPWVHQLAT
jgi:hypothetical protein